MKSAKAAVGLLVITVGFAVAGLIFSTNKTNFAPAVSEPNKQQAAEIPTSEILPPKQSTPAGTILSSAENETENDPSNLTSLFARQLANDVFKNNPDGPTLSENNDLSFFMSNMDQAFISSQSEKLNLIPKIQDAEIIISKQNSKTDLEQYLNNLKTILVKLNRSLPTQTINENNKEIVFQFSEMLVKSYAAGIKDMMALPVPQTLKDFHKQEIALVTAQKNVFEKITKEIAAKDPLVGIVAVRYMKKIDEQFAALKTEINAFIKKNNLNIK